MATSLNTNLQHRSLSCGTKIYAGLKLQSPCLFATGKPSLNADFFSRVNKSLQRGRRNCNPTMERVVMMPMGTPKVPYRAPGQETWQWVDIWNALYRERVVFITEHIDEEFSNQVLATMLYLDSIDNNNRLYLYINGPGGDIYPSLSLYDTVKSLKTPIGTHCLGYAFNLASFLLAAGEKGYRSAMPLSRISLEPPAGAARGQADDISNEANELLKVRDYLYSELAKNTGQSFEKIKQDISKVKRFTAQEAVDYGLIDRIVRPRRIKE
ncbi:ATP-dependent Clp protease proteolytic subunit-related protein 2, chloroplastic [Durio zibethinus]|uniref:ATP-dependent Clp protease proteolytic subunit n=1 Tax=Durio zibethinus TaxID=66656 RepID=A0A6P5WUV7_DURZI|nr:ATP-dependent Clp protease proteolytic subunit-related protein 2, chloroplastic [Durio zibethinus]